METIILNEGDNICDKCNGTGKIRKECEGLNSSHKVTYVCDKCRGSKKLNWIEVIKGKRKPKFGQYSFSIENLDCISDTKYSKEFLNDMSKQIADEVDKNILKKFKDEIKKQITMSYSCNDYLTEG